MQSSPPIIVCCAVSPGRIWNCCCREALSDAARRILPVDRTERSARGTGTVSCGSSFGGVLCVAISVSSSKEPWQEIEHELEIGIDRCGQPVGFALIGRRAKREN